MSNLGYKIRIIDDNRIRLEVGTPRRVLFAILAIILTVIFLIIVFEPMIPETLPGFILIISMILICSSVAGLNRYFDFNVKSKIFNFGITFFGFSILKERHDISDITALSLVSVSYNLEEFKDIDKKSETSPLLGVFLPGRSSIRPYKEYVNLSIELVDRKISLEDAQQSETLLVHGQFIANFLKVAFRNQQK